MQQSAENDLSAIGKLPVWILGVPRKGSIVKKDAFYLDGGTA